MCRREFTARFRGLDNTLEAYAEPVPFVAEVWSRSTGEYDVGEKLDEYRARGDREIWLLHPYERRLTAHRLRSDGNYDVVVFASGSIHLAAVSGVRVDLAKLFSR